MTIRAGDCYVRKFMSFDIRAPGYLMRLDGMAGGALHAFGHVHVGILCGRNAMLVIWPPAGAGMTAQTHLVRGILDILGSLENIHTISWNDLELISFLSDFTPIIGSMTN